MTIRHIWIATATWLASCAMCLALADDASPTLYAITTTVNAQVTLPAPDGNGKHLWQDKQGNWQPLQTETDEGRLRFRLRVDDIQNGQTLVVLNCPEEVDLNDQTPPEIVYLAVDGNPVDPAANLDLGSVSEPPARIVATFRDESNNLVPESLTVSVGGQSYSVENAAVSWHPETLRQGTATILLGELFATPPDGRVTLSVSIDDAALDRAKTRLNISFAYTAPHKLADGRILAVDSVTDSGGWADWWVLADGVKMDESMPTTAGYTWLSQPTDGPHWVQMTFPEAREISTVRLWWPYYQTYRTSRAYRIDVRLPEGDWRTVAEITDQTEKQVSEHRFDPLNAKAVRVWQPALSGQRERAEYMWLSEIEVE